MDNKLAWLLAVPKSNQDTSGCSKDHANKATGIIELLINPLELFEAALPGVPKKIPGEREAAQLALSDSGTHEEEIHRAEKKHGQPRPEAQDNDPPVRHRERTRK